MKSILDPDIDEILEDSRESIFKDLNCVKVGRIVEFDKTKKTARIQIMFKKVFQDKSEVSYPLLVDCPVFTLQGSDNSFIQIPIKKGTDCLVLFADRNIDRWLENGTELAPDDSRAHDISDGIAIVGLNSFASSMQDYSDDELRIIHENAEIIQKNDKIRMANQLHTLLTLLEGLIDVIKSISTVAGGGVLDPASIAALEAYKTVIKQLLY